MAIYARLKKATAKLKKVIIIKQMIFFG